MDPQKKKRTDVINSIMRDKKLSRIFHEATNSPVGSTKRDKARHIISILNKINPSGRFDGEGGPGGTYMNIDGSSPGGDQGGNTNPGSFLGNAGNAISQFQNSNPNTPSSPPPPPAPDLTQNQSSSVHIFPATPEFNTQTDATPPLGGTQMGSNFYPNQGNSDSAFPKPVSTSNQTDSSSLNNVSITDKTNIVPGTSPDSSAGSSTSSTNDKNAGSSSDSGASTTTSGSGLSGGAAHNIAMNIPGMTNITMPFSQAVTQFGLNTLIDGFIANEGKNGVGNKVNNPGDIKIPPSGLLPGQSHSGIFATDGGEFAAYATPTDGRKAIGDILMSAAAGNGPYGTGPDGKNPSFEFVANKYTGTDQNNGSSSDTTGTPGEGAKTIQGAYDYMNAAIASGESPSDVADKWMQQIATSGGNDPSAILLARNNLGMLGSKMDQLNNMAPELPQYLQDYAKNHDNLITSVNILEQGVATALRTGVGINSDNLKGYTDSLTFLENVKATQSANYLKYINKGIAQFDTNLSNVTTEYNKAQTLYDTAMSQGDALTPASYANTYKILQSTADYLEKAPGLLQSQLDAETAKTTTNLDTVTGMINSTKLASMFTKTEQNSAAVKAFGYGSDSSDPRWKALPSYMQSFFIRMPTIVQTVPDVTTGGNKTQKTPYYTFIRPYIVAAQSEGAGGVAGTAAIKNINQQVTAGILTPNVANYLLAMIPGSSPTKATSNLTLGPVSTTASTTPSTSTPAPKQGFWSRLFNGPAGGPDSTPN